jgi:hypothetical protein
MSWGPFWPKARAVGVPPPMGTFITVLSVEGKGVPKFVQ